MACEKQRLAEAGTTMNHSPTSQTLCVIGLGYVGLTTAVGFAELGHKVIGVDVDDEKIKTLNRGISPIYEAGMEQLLRKNRDRLTFTVDLKEAVASSSIIFVAVGTPTKDTGEADLSQIIDVAHGLSESINNYKIIVIKSTVPVGSVDLIRNIMSQKCKEGKDFDLVVNPEFLREGNAIHDFFNPSRVVIGADNKQAAQVVAQLYKPLSTPVLVTSPIDAQMIKYAANAFLASRISFINEIATISERVGADIKNIIKGLSYDPRLGDGYLSPGIGFGGPCLTKDLKALIHMAQSYDYEPRFLKSILERNEEQIRSIVWKVKKALGGILYGKTIGVLGLAFKPGTKDIRNSPAVRIVKLLKQGGALIKAYDPMAMDEAKIILPDIEYCTTPYEFKNLDLLLLLVGWEEFKQLDYQRLKGGMSTPIIIDGANLLEPKVMKELGFTYSGVGR